MLAFENGVSSKIDDVLPEDCGLFHVLPLAVHLQDFSVSPSPLGGNLGLELGWTGLGLGTNGFGVGD